LGRFLSADTIVPGYANPQNLNRFSYVLNNPIRYNDPTGHVCSDPDDPTPSCDGSGGPPPNQTPLPDGPVDIPGGPLDPGQEQDDPTPKPSGGGGHPLLSLSNDTTQNCLSNPYCFNATQADLFNQANTLHWTSIGLYIAAAIIGGIGLALVMEGIVTTPIGGLGVVSIIVGLGLVAVGGYLIAEGSASSQASSYLASIAASMDSQDTVQFNVQSNNYQLEGTNYSYNPSLPLTSLLMQDWAQNQQNR
jgi:hypothetical protein